jgi:protein dithiol oxidoreductase (disulfide-forming)
MKSVFIKRLIWVLLLLPVMLQAKEYKEGVEYIKLATPVPTQNADKIEVQEFFWYGCPHCFQFEPKMAAWVKNKPANVEFVRMPSPLNPNWMAHTKTFYALEAMGRGDEFHVEIFNAMHVAKLKLFTPEAIADFLAQKGVDRTKFLDSYNSFAVNMRARKAEQLGNQYKITGVPAISVNGKYLINTNQTGGFDEVLNILSYLVNKEAAAK